MRQLLRVLGDGGSYGAGGRVHSWGEEGARLLKERGRWLVRNREGERVGKGT